MNNSGRTIAFIAILCGTLGSAPAVIFGPSATINGVKYLVGSPASPVSVLANGIAFSLPSAVAVGTPKTVTLGYTVSSDKGFYLSSVDQDPLGLALLGKVQISSLHKDGPVTETALFSATNVTTLGDAATNLVGGHITFNVSTTISLQPTAHGLVKTTEYIAAYGQSVASSGVQTVPEPATIGILAVGLVTGYRSRRRR